MGGKSNILDVRFFAPPARLAPYFTTFYRLDVRPVDGATVSDYLQPEWSGMRLFQGPGPVARSGNGAELHGQQMQVGGPTCTPTHFTLQETRLWGFGFMPLGWATYIGTNASDRTNWIGDGMEAPEFQPHRSLFTRLLQGADDDEEEFAIIVEHFEELDHDHPDRGRILTVHEALLDPETANVAELARKSGMTTRTLERLCLKHFGFSPNVLMRRQRMMRTLSAFMLDQSSTWSRVIDQNYHDQAHFVREFQHFMRMSPSEYASMDHPILSAFMAARMRIWGSPVQTLDRPNGPLDLKGAAA